MRPFCPIRGACAVGQPCDLPEPARAKATRELGQQLVDVYGSEAVNVTLQCQNAFLERGEEETAAQMLQVLTAIWDIEDRVAA